MVYKRSFILGNIQRTAKLTDNTLSGLKYTHIILIVSDFDMMKRDSYPASWKINYDCHIVG